MKMRMAPISLVVLFYGFASFGFSALAGETVPDTEALKHLGQNVTVEGTVTRVFKSKNGNTFVAWIPAYAPEAMDSALSSLQGKKVRISGTIQSYRDKPEIKVMTKEQIAVE
jgi:hypothetical protein